MISRSLGSVHALVLSALLIACGEDEPAAPAPAPEPPPPSAPIAASRPVADTAAFAFVPVADGALLLFGAPFAGGGGVRALRLGPLGQVLGTEQPIASHGAAAGGATEQRLAQVVELDAAASGQRVGVAWVLDHGDSVEIQSAFSPDGGRRFSAPQELGATVRIERGHRGRLALAAADDGTLSLYRRTPEAPCADGHTPCAHIVRVALGSDRPEPDRAGGLEVPFPCEPFVGGALARSGSWYYALCHQESAPTATIYALRPSIDYASALDANEGCVPSGIAPLDEGAAVITRCDRELALIDLDAMGRERGRFSIAERSVTCRDGRPVLHVAGGAQSRELALGSALDHLEGLLPESVAPSGARAIWTGEALLVAAPVAGEISLRRHQCVRGDRFDRTDVR